MLLGLKASLEIEPTLGIQFGAVEHVIFVDPKQLDLQIFFVFEQIVGPGKDVAFFVLLCWLGQDVGGRHNDA